MTGPLVALSTVATEADADRIARSLVEKGLAACVNVVPGLVSVYRWKGKVEREPETLLVIKTHGERFEELKAALLAEHPYELPELVALPIAAGHEPYLEWLSASVKA
jgi:periplasmic divalent cation tolerance protein